MSRERIFYRIIYAIAIIFFVVTCIVSTVKAFVFDIDHPTLLAYKCS